MSERSLDGKVVILTGGGGLLGRQHANVLSACGAHVVVADTDADAAARVVASLPGAEGLAVETDVTQPSSVRNLMACTMERFETIDALVNNAALDPKFDSAHERTRRDSFERFPLDAWRRSLAVDLTGAFLCTQAVAPFLLAKGEGSIVNVSSIYGVVGPDQRIYQRQGEPERCKPVAYSVAKSGLLGLTRYLAAYWAGTGVRVNALTLGGVENGHDPDFVRRYSERTPLGRMARKDEHSGALAFLLSADASYMTGANLVVDGGWTAW